MFEALQAPLLFGLIAAFVTTLGLFAVAVRSEWSLRYANLFGLAAAGLLATLAFLHIIPEAFALSNAAPVWLTVGFFSGLFIHYIIKALFPDREGSGLPSEAITPILAIAIHSFIDGIVYSVTFAVSFSTGVLATVGLILHEFPEGIIAFAILRRYGVSTRGALLWAFLAAAATTPIGVLVSGPFMFGLGEDLLGSLFALSAGLLLFVATGPLMSPLKDVKPALGLGSLGIGVAIALMLVLAPIPGHDHDHIGHAHEHDEHDHDAHEHHSVLPPPSYFR